MSQAFTVKAEARNKVGKGAARHLRRSGMIPAVIYGDKQDPLPIAIPYKETFLALHAGGFMTHVATIDVDGQKIRVLPKDYQLEPVRDFLMHVDFLRVSEKTRVTVEIPVHFENEEAVARSEARRRPQRRAPRGRGACAGERDPRGLHDRPHRARDRRFHPRLGPDAAERTSS